MAKKTFFTIRDEKYSSERIHITFNADGEFSRIYKHVTRGHSNIYQPPTITEISVKEAEEKITDKESLWELCTVREENEETVMYNGEKRIARRLVLGKDTTGFALFTEDGKTHVNISVKDFALLEIC